MRTPPPGGAVPAGGVTSRGRPVPAQGVAAREAPGLRLTHLDKVLWPPACPGGVAYTKGDYLDYLRAIAPHLLPHLRGRPLVLTRYPHGAAGPSFYQKHLPPSAPAWLPRFRHVSGSGRAIDYLVPEGLADLLWLGQQAAIEFHPWLSTCARPDHPDRAVVDLDPMPPAGFEDARAVAEVVRDLLARAGVASWPKTSGASGLHVFIPVRPVLTYRQVAQLMRGLGEAVRRAVPERVTLERRVALRAGRVYFDYLQNGRGKTLCAPYCPRPLPGAPVSTPLEWSELAAVQPAALTLGTVVRRLRAGCDPFASLAGAPPQDLRPLADLVRRLLAARVPR